MSSLRNTARLGALGALAASLIGASVWAQSRTPDDASDADLAKESEAPAQTLEPSASISTINLGGEDSFSTILKGTITTPFDEKFGASFDIYAGSGEGSPLYGAGARVFWHDQDVGRLGVFGMGTRGEFSGLELSVFGVGAEGALYFDWLEIEAAAAFTTGDVVPDDFVAIAGVAVYPLEQLRLSAGTRYYSEKFHGAFDVELGFRSFGASIFTGGMFNEDEDWRVLSGLKVQLGGGGGDDGGGGGAGIGAALTAVTVSSASDAAAAAAEEFQEAAAEAAAAKVSSGPCTHTHAHGHGSANNGHRGHGHRGAARGQTHTHPHTHNNGKCRH